MSPKLAQLIQQAENLSAEEQLKLIAHLAQKLSGITQVNSKLPQPDSTQTKEIPERGKSIWQIAEDFVKDIPEEELSKLPSDGAEQHDHYIYGTPKIEA